MGQVATPDFRSTERRGEVQGDVPLGSLPQHPLLKGAWSLRNPKSKIQQHTIGVHGDADPGAQDLCEVHEVHLLGFQDCGCSECSGRKGSGRRF